MSLFLETQFAPIEDGDDHDRWAEFRVSGHAPIGDLMRLIVDKKLPTLISGASEQVIRGTVAQADQAAGMVDLAVDMQAEATAALIERGQATAVAYDANLKLQFGLSGFERVESEEGAFLRTAFPTAVFRLQRRSAYRVRPPETVPVALRFRHPIKVRQLISCRVLDLSLGGCRLSYPLDAPELPSGTNIVNARLELDAETKLLITLQVRFTQDMVDEEGHRQGQAMGCIWAPMSADTERELYFYIDRMQKRLRLTSQAA